MFDVQFTSSSFDTTGNCDVPFMTTKYVSKFDAHPSITIVPGYNVESNT